MSYGILVTVSGVLPDDMWRRLLTGGNGQPNAGADLRGDFAVTSWPTCWF